MKIFHDVHCEQFSFKWSYWDVIERKLNSLENTSKELKIMLKLENAWTIRFNRKYEEMFWIFSTNLLSKSLKFYFTFFQCIFLLENRVKLMLNIYWFGFKLNFWCDFVLQIGVIQVALGTKITPYIWMAAHQCETFVCAIFDVVCDKSGISDIDNTRNDGVCDAFRVRFFQTAPRNFEHKLIWKSWK